MFYFSLFAFAVLPSFIWLLYYLKKDIHPEPRKLIAYVFFAGFAAAIIGYFFQIISASFLLSFLDVFPYLLLFCLFVQKFIIVSFSEELLKYFAFFFTIRGHQELDEPVDFVIYMVTAAMGFAAMENLFLFFSLSSNIMFAEVIQTSFFRFISATLFHALSSGILGVFMAYSCRLSQRSIFIYGLLAVTLFHGIYNMLVSRIENFSFILLLILLLLFLSFVLSFGIKKLEKMHSVCLLKTSTRK